MASKSNAFEKFLDFSAAVTGFSKYRLLGTGEADEFFATLCRILGHDLLTELLAATYAAQVDAGLDELRREHLFRARIFSDEKLGPIARNVIKLWYVGVWYRLPDPWHDLFKLPAEDRDQIVSNAAYTEALLWPAIGANPPGAKGPGFGTWAEPPRISEY
ncbi:MAG TPA: hypothetical protein VMG10_10075 [Gemmataceae bacterium]|nr:hypothetical protein [Gemmataceae bacterium]